MPILRWRLVRISGLSMTPTLVDGDIALVRLAKASPAKGLLAKDSPARDSPARDSPARDIVGAPGDIVLARFRSRPDLVVIKRLDREQDGGWLLSSDNVLAGSDSRTYGVADIDGTTCWCWRRRPPLARRRGLRWIPLRLSRVTPAG